MNKKKPTLINYFIFSNNKDAMSIPKNERKYSVYMYDKERLPQEEDHYKDVPPVVGGQ
ncbi:MAG: hypothetical protein H8E55_17185 [Pelagibacterales bacterium]|nr:hypothetical protein [Pelagibacterales bacterium]